MGKQEWKAPESIAYCDAKGATLLDEFAGRVLQGIYSDQKALIALDNNKAVGGSLQTMIAEICYGQAQAMLEERKNHVPG